MIQEIEDERQRQIEKGYTPDHDDTHTISDWLCFISARCNTPNRKSLVEIAALSIAAIESIERKS